MQKMGCFGVVKRHSGSWAMSPFDTAHTTSTLVFNFNRNYESTLYLVSFSRSSELFVQVADFNLSHLHLAPPLWVTPVEFR